MRHLLAHLLVLILPVAACLTPAIVMQSGALVASETEEHQESHRTSGETLAQGRRPVSVTSPPTSLHGYGRVLLSGRSHPCPESGWEPALSGHCWWNGLCAPLRI